jgi:hypothetical protein
VAVAAEEGRWRLQWTESLKTPQNDGWLSFAFFFPYRALAKLSHYPKFIDMQLLA